MPHVAVAVFHVARVVIIPEEAMQVVGAEEISSPSQRINSLLVSFVEGPITWCSKCYRRFDPSYMGEEKLVNTAHSMELIPIGMETQGQPIMSVESLRNLP
jgi:hypothetical protein